MASINDKFIKTSVVEPTRLRDPLSSSATTLTVESTAGWNGDTAILAVIDRVDSAGNLTPDKMEIVIGTMNAGGLEQLRRGVGGRAQVHSSGAIVELSIAGSEQWNRAMDALISAFGQDGKIKESAFASGLQVVDGSVIKDGSIEPGKLKTAEPTIISEIVQLGFGVPGRFNKVNKVVYFHIDAICQNYESVKMIEKLPEKFRPQNNARFVGACINTNNFTGGFTLKFETDGSITKSGTTGKQEYVCSGCYLTAN